MKNCPKLKQVLTKFSIALLLISHASPVFATTIEEISQSTNPIESMVDPEESISSEDLPTADTESTSEESILLETTSSFDTTDSTLETDEQDMTSSPGTSEETSENSDFSVVESNTQEVESTIEDTLDSIENSSNITESVEESMNTESSEELTEETLEESEIETPEEKQEIIFYPDASRSLGQEMAAQSFVASDLNGFELPLLQTYTDQREAALVATALNYLNTPYEEGGSGPDSFDNHHFPRYLYEKVFALAIESDFRSLTTIGNQVTVEEVQPGDLLIWEEEQKVGIYLGQDKFIMADDTLAKEKRTQGEEMDVPGVRIFTLHREITGEESDNQDLLTRYDFIGTPDYGVAKKVEWTLSEAGTKAISQYPASFYFQGNDQTNAFIDGIGEAARDLGLEYDLFASVLIAQAILESAAGSSGLGIAPYYNLFGIKGSSGSSSVVLPTQEDNGQGKLYSIQSAFRVYPSQQASLEDYVHLIRTGISGNPQFYQGVWRSTAKNYLKATAELTGKYATDTFYYNKLNSLIATYQLTRFDEPRAAVSNSMLSLAEIPMEYRDKIRFPEYNGQNYNVSGSYGSDQCTWYVYNRVIQLGGKVGDFMGNGADWKETGTREGYQTSDIPKAGYMISFKQGVAGYHPLYGHVAFVEAVGEEGILISEGDASYLSYRIIPNEIALSKGVGYIVPK